MFAPQVRGGRVTTRVNSLTCLVEWRNVKCKSWLLTAEAYVAFSVRKVGRSAAVSSPLDDSSLTSPHSKRGWILFLWSSVHGTGYLLRSPHQRLTRHDLHVPAGTPRLAHQVQQTRNRVCKGKFSNKCMIQFTLGILELLKKWSAGFIVKVTISGSKARSSWWTSKECRVDGKFANKRPIPSKVGARSGQLKF